MTYEIYDKRTDEVVFKNDDMMACVGFLSGVSDDEEKFPYYYLRKVQSPQI